MINEGSCHTMFKKVIIINNQTQRSPGRPKQAQDELSIHETIIHTASQLFMENGYEPVTLQQIANECNVSKPSIYYHFTSKSELFKIAITTMLNNVHNNVSRLLKESDTLEAGLLRVAEARIANPHSEVETIIKEAGSSLSDEQIHEIRITEQQIYQVLSDYFKDWMDKEILRTEDPLFLAHAFSSLLLISNRSDLMQKYATRNEPAKKVVDMFLSGTLL